MTTDIRNLALQLRAWSEPIASGYEVPAAARTLHAAADALEAMAGEVERLNKLNDELDTAASERLLRAFAAEAERDRQAVAREVAGLKQSLIIMSNKRCDAVAERDRLKGVLEALEAVRSDLPEKVSEQWLYEGVRHWHRNCDWDDPRDGSPLDRGDGATVAKILNMIPRKALGGDE